MDKKNIGLFTTKHHSKEIVVNNNIDIKLNNEKCVAVELQLDVKLYDAINDLAKEKKITPAGIISEWIHEKINPSSIKDITILQGSFENAYESFNENAYENLVELIEKFGTGLIDNPIRTKSLLNDVCGELKREINILTIAQSNKVPEALSKISGKTWTQELRVISKKLSETTGLEDRAANWAVNKWVGILLRNSTYYIPLKQDFAKDLAGDTIAPGSDKPGDSKSSFASKLLVIKQILDPDTSIKSICFSYDKSLLAVGTGNGFLIMFRMDESNEIFSVKAHSGAIKTLSFSGNGKFIASGSTDKSVKVWESLTGKLEKELIGHRFGVTAVSISPTGYHLASASLDGSVKIWEINSGSLIKSLSAHKFTVTSLSFSLTGRYLATASWDESIKLWEIPEGIELRTLYGHTGNVENVLFSPDGRSLLSGSTDKSIRLWEAFVIDRSKSLGKQEKPASALAFSKNGRFIVAGTLDSCVKLYEIETGSVKKVLNEAGDIIPCVAISNDATLVAFAEYSNAIKIYEIDFV